MQLLEQAEDRSGRRMLGQRARGGSILGFQVAVERSAKSNRLRRRGAGNTSELDRVHGRPQVSAHVVVRSLG